MDLKACYDGRPAQALPTNDQSSSCANFRGLAAVRAMSATRRCRPAPVCEPAPKSVTLMLAGLPSSCRRRASMAA